jgi:large subunit ribosomal protein L24
MAKRKPEPNKRPLHIRTGDDVIVLSGSGRSKTTHKVLSVQPKANTLIVEGVNVMKDRQKPQGGQPEAGINQGGIIEKAFPIHRSKVALVDPGTKKATRVKMVKDNAGKRVRAAVKSGTVIG